MKVKYESNSKEHQMFKDFYSLCQFLGEPEETEEYWKTVVEWNGKFYAKYKDISLATKLSVALMEDLEDRFRKKVKTN